jgi:GTP-binding protein
VVYISVKTNEGVDRLMDEVLKIYERWNCRVSTGLLNDWLRRFKKLDNLPIDGNNQLKVRYIVQAKVRPPTFVAFVNNK